MQFVWRRYSRSGYAGMWFYVLVALGFCALAAWAIAEQDWVVMALAVAMVPATIGGSRIMRRLRDAEAASRDDLARQAKEATNARTGDDHDG